MEVCRKSYLLCLIFICNAIGQKDTNEAPVVELKQGKLKGLEENSTEGKRFFSYLGIPFAKPPVGDLRFEDPVEHEKWDGVLEANKMPEMCAQVMMADEAKGRLSVIGSEDCLYLNVFSPKPLPTDEKLAVMVFIHGGGFKRGAASFYQPYLLLNEDIVLVVIQYRLGVFGFLSTEDSTMPGNMGLKDQRMALQWVQKNIERFGGNPEQVTIFGESAGAGSVHLQMMSPGSKGLFRGVIAQSGTALCPWSISADHRKYAQTYGDKLDCSLSKGSEYFKQCLKKRDVLPLMYQMGYQLKWGTFPLSTTPRVDGDFIPDEPAKLLKSRKYTKVDLMAGVMKEEGGLYTSMMYSNAKLKEVLIKNFSVNAPYSLMTEEEPNAAKLSKSIYDFYLRGKTLEEDPLDELTKMFGNSYFHIPHDLTMLLHAEHNVKLYLYEFNYKGKRSLIDIVNADFKHNYASHGDDLFFFFSGGLFLGQPSTSPDDISLSKKLVKLWTNFAKYGNPTPKDAFDFVWKTAAPKAFEHLSITVEPKMEKFTRSEELDFWTTLKMRRNEMIIHIGGRGTIETKDEFLVDNTILKNNTDSQIQH